MLKSNDVIAIFLVNNEKIEEIKDDVGRMLNILLNSVKVKKFNLELPSVPENAVYEIDAQDFTDLFIMVNNLKDFFDNFHFFVR